MKRLTKNLMMLVMSVALVTSCAELDIKNDAQPDQDRVLSSASDVASIAYGAFNTWYQGTHSYDGVGMMMGTAADNGSCSWGNQAMRDMSWEPRKAWDNSPNYPYAGITNYNFYRLYSALGSANDVLGAAKNGMDWGDDTDMIVALSQFIQGISMGYVGLIYDQGYIVDENSTTEEQASPTLIPYGDVVDAGVAKLEAAIATASGAADFTIPASVFGGVSLTKDQFVKVANSFAARILAYAPRTATENASVDWGAVKTFATNGVDFDFGIEGDGWNQWMNEHMVYLVYPGWARTDMRIVNMMDSNQPDHWTDDASFPHPDESDYSADEDDRLETDFQYLSSNNFRVERGYYHFSNYRFSRYDNIIGPYTGFLPEIMKAENDLLLAEAELELGNASVAADIINAGTRVSRGGLAPVAADAAAVTDAIHRERQIELMCTGLGIQFFDMRKRDLLQKGTILHIPVASRIYELLGSERPFPTFGGSDEADGVNSSAGGWR